MKFEELKKEFFETENGKNLKVRFNRILIYSIILLICGLAFLVEAIIKHESITNYIYSALLIITGFVFIIARLKVINKQVVQYGLTKKEKKSKKKKKS